MEICRIDEDRNWPFNYDFKIERNLGLPGIRCGICGKTWGGPGPIYPQLVLPPSVRKKAYQERWPVTPERFKELAARVRPFLALARPALISWGNVWTVARARFWRVRRFYLAVLLDAADCARG